MLLEEEEIGQPTYAVNKKERNFTNLPKDVLKYHLVRTPRTPSRAKTPLSTNPLQRLFSLELGH